MEEGEKEFQTAKRAPIETGISQGTDSVHRQFGHFGTQGVPSGAGRGRGGLPMRLFHSLSADPEESPFESAPGRGRGRPPNRRFHPAAPDGISSEEGMGRSRHDPSYRHFPDFLRRRGFGWGTGRGNGPAHFGSFPEDLLFDEDFLFECILHRFICPLYPRRGFFESDMRRSTGPVNRNPSSEDTRKEDNSPTVSKDAGNSSGNTKKKIPIDGKKIACIFAYDYNPGKPSRANVDDSELILSTLKDLGFKIDDGSTPEEKEDTSSSEEEDSDEEFKRKHKKKASRVKLFDDLVLLNQRPSDTVSFLSTLVQNNREATCFFLYFIVKQVGSKFLTEEDKQLPIFDIWKQFKKTAVPVIIFIQAAVKEETQYFSVLMNRDGRERVKLSTIPRSANVVIGYLPSKGDRKESVAKIVSEELRSKFDINTVLTNVIDRMNAEDCKLSPKFSSTLIKPLYLAEGIGDTKGQVPTSYSRKGKYLAYAFLFSQYNEDVKVSDLSTIRELDEINLLTLRDLNVELEFCVVDGKMTVDEFKSKLAEILQREDLDSCDCIFIIISSHGCENLHIYAYDGIFSLDYVWHQLSSCEKLKNKPKVILTDACRGFYSEERVFYEETISKGRHYKPTPVTGIPMCDIEQISMTDTLIALATTNGKMAFAGSGGSTFMSSLCQMLKTCSSEDFLTILTETIKKVALLDSYEKQQVTFTSTLRKLLYLPEKKEDKEGK